MYPVLRPRKYIGTYFENIPKPVVWSLALCRHKPFGRHNPLMTVCEVPHNMPCKFQQVAGFPSCQGFQFLHLKASYFLCM